MAIRVVSLDVGKISGVTHKDLLDIAHELKRVSNRIWQVWEHWHLDNDTPTKQRKYLDDLAAWREADKKSRGEKPKAPCQSVPRELQNLIYRTISREFPTLHKRVIVLHMQKIVKTIKTRKAAHGSLPGWCSILLCHEAKPSFTEPQPISFDAQPKSPQAILVPTDGDNKDWRLKLAAVRDPKTAKTVWAELVLLTRKRKATSARRILEKIVAGEARFRGSNIVWVKSKRKWFAQITYEMEQPKPELDHSKRAVFMPGRNDPWIMLADGRLFFRGGTGRHVIGVRRALIFERMERQEHYRWAGHNARGHGRGRATSVWRKMTTRWREFQKLYNHDVTTKLVGELVNRGIGTLEYWQPIEGRQDSRFLVHAGRGDYSGPSAKGWMFFEVGNMLAQKCERAGIKFVRRNFGRKSCSKNTSSSSWAQEQSASKPRPKKSTAGT